jgi:hypothetical protein
MMNMRKVVAVFDRGDVAQADLALARYVSKNNERTEKAILAAFPKRAKIVRAVFWAHRQRQYFLSVPVMLTQADGICVDELGGELFQRERATGRSRAAKGLSQAPPAQAAFLAPLGEIIPVMASQKERSGMSPHELFRHTVLHGESIDYGTHTNSCKAISLLRYLAWLLPELRQPQTTP